MRNKWGVLWVSDNKLDGHTEHFLWDKGSHATSVPLVFPTRADAREYIAERYGFIGSRPDLRREPHGLKMPRAIKCKITVEQV